MAGLAGKIVIITGGSRGIGAACVRSFAQEKATVIFTYNQNQQLAQQLAQELNGSGLSCEPVALDVRDFQACKNLVQRVLKQRGTIDILINNAGIVRDKALMMMTEQDWHDVIDTNLGGVFNMTRSVITTFLKQKSGCIINMSSVSGLIGIARQTNYSASKAAIIGFSRSLAKEVAPYNVRVNAVCPGFILTDMVTSLREDIKKDILAQIPAKRLGTPEEVARMCLFLASDQNQYMNGEVIKIDGGLAA